MSIDEVLLSQFPSPDIEEIDLKEEAERQQAEQQFRIQTDEQANWALRKIAKIRKQMADDQALAEAEIQRIRLWLDRETEKLQRHEHFFTTLLQNYHREILAQDPHRRTISLPAGTIQFRRQQPEYERDEHALVAWLEANNLLDFVKIEKHADWANFKKVIRPAGQQAVNLFTGEAVEGITVREREDKFIVDVEVR